MFPSQGTGILLEVIIDELRKKGVCVCVYYKVCSEEDPNAMIFEQKPEISGQS